MAGLTTNPPLASQAAPFAKGAPLQKIVMMAGGTGGHIFPGLAIAKALQQKGVKIHWLGSVGGMETTIVPKENIPLTTLTISGWRGKSFFQQLLLPWRLLQAIYQAFCFLRREKPDIVMGMGGFAAGPGGIAAKLLDIPLIIHEQNRIAGMTNRYLAKIAKYVLCAFPDTFPLENKVIVTGNPVRTEISALLPPAQRYATIHSPLRILVLGGSRGAKILNETVPEAIALLPANLRPEICHQTGNAHQTETKVFYTKFAVNADVVSFIDNIAERYAWADIIICRAGASTVTEIMAVGLPAIFIPYPHATDDHQTANARYLTDKNAGILLPQSQLTAQTLCRHLQKLLGDATLRLQLATHARRLRQEETLEKIVEVCEKK